MNRSSPVRLIFTIAALSGVAACTVGPEYKPPTVELPETFKSAAPEETVQPHLTPTWWKLFNDPHLDEFEAKALELNDDLKAAVSRVTQARAYTRSIQSQYYPVITFDPSVSRSRTPDERRGAATGATIANSIRIPFDLSYEVDVWGRVKHSVELADAQARASEADFGVVLQTITADIAQNYFTIRSLDAQEKILSDTLELLRHEVDLTRKRQKVGVVAATDSLQAQIQVDTAEAQLVEVHRQRADAEHALAILTGQSPSAVSVAISPLVEQPVVVPAGLPAELLKHRADVIEAEENLIAACASVGIAYADYYPVFSLSGLAGFESVDFKHALDWESRIWSIGAAASAPIFEGGKLDADLAQAKAHYDELRATYRSVVLAAIRDVEDALTDLHMRADSSAALDRTVKDSSEYLRLTKLQYTQGLVSYLQVIDAERTLLNNQLQAAQTLNLRFTSSVLLMKALGGGWDPEILTKRTDFDAAAGPPR